MNGLDRVLVVTAANPAPPWVYPRAWRSHQNLSWMGRLDFLELRGEPPGEEQDRILAKYREARLTFLRGPYDALLSLEADIIAPPDALLKLAAAEAPVAYGVYCWRRNRPYWNAYGQVTEIAAWSLSEYPRLAHRAWGEVVDVAGIGSGCTLLRREVLEALDYWRPGHAHQDYGLALSCQRAGFRQVADLAVICGHIHAGRLGRVVWPDDAWPFFRFEDEKEGGSKGMYLFTGDTWLPGIPKRDLTDAEWAALTPREQEAAAPHYEYVPDFELSDPPAELAAEEENDGNE